MEHYLCGVTTVSPTGFHKESEKQMIIEKTMNQQQLRDFMKQELIIVDVNDEPNEKIMLDTKTNKSLTFDEWLETQTRFVVGDIVFTISNEEHQRLSFDQYVTLFKIVDTHRKTLTNPVFLEIENNGALLLRQ